MSFEECWFLIRIEEQQKLADRITRAYDLALKISKNPSKGVLNAHYEVLEKNWTRFEEEHNALLLEIKRMNLSAYYSKIPKFIDTQEAYLKEKGEFLEAFDLLSHQDSRNHGNAEYSKSRPSNLDIPKFSGSYSEWNLFSHLFQALIGMNPSFTPGEKVQLLKKNISDEAAQLLEDVPIPGEKFTKVWDILSEKYDNKRFLVNTHVSNICKIEPLTNESILGLKELLNVTVGNLEALSAMGRPVEYWSDWIVFITVERLDPLTRKDWEKSLEKFTDPPTFERLKIFLQSRILALEDMKTKVMSTAY